MTRLDPIPGTAPIARVAGPHQSTVTTILRAVERGLFTAAEADMMIDRVRAHLTAPPIKPPVSDALPDKSRQDILVTTSRWFARHRLSGAESDDVPARGDDTVNAVLTHVSTDRPARGRRPASPPTAGQLLTITTHPAPPAATVLTVRGEVDALTSPQLRDSLLPHLNAANPQVIVDLTDVGFFTAAGLTVLASARQAAMATGVTLCLVASTRPVLLPLTITGLDRVFSISPNLTHALLRAGCGPDG
jgi:anti-sigma B factor antagonist